MPTCTLCRQLTLMHAISISRVSYAKQQHVKRHQQLHYQQTHADLILIWQIKNNYFNEYVIISSAIKNARLFGICSQFCMLIYYTVMHPHTHTQLRHVQNGGKCEWKKAHHHQTVVEHTIEPWWVPLRALHVDASPTTPIYFTQKRFDLNR